MFTQTTVIVVYYLAKDCNRYIIQFENFTYSDPKIEKTLAIYCKKISTLVSLQ